MAKYRSRRSQCTAPYDVTTLEVLTSFVKVDGSGFFEAARPIEEQVDQCIIVLSKLCERLGVDVSNINPEFEIAPNSDI